MRVIIFTILEAAALSSALSLDAFVASFAYGSKGIKIPIKSANVINLVCGAITGISLLIGSVIKHYIPPWLTALLSFTILTVLGIIKLMDSITKSIIRAHSSIDKEIKFSFFNFKFILRLYANPEDADIDDSKVLSPGEAATLALALSLDGITVGLGAAVGNINGLAVFICSLVVNIAAVVVGSIAGNRFAGRHAYNLSWLSGTILIIMAVSKLI